MNQKSSIMILGSGLMVLTLATLVGLFLFSPASKSARARASSEESSYPDIATLTQESADQASTTTQKDPASVPAPSSSALVPSRNYRFGQGSNSTTPLTSPESGVSVSRPSQQGQSNTSSQNSSSTSQQRSSAQIWDQVAPTTQTPRSSTTSNQVAVAPPQKPATTATPKKTTPTAPAAKKTSPPAKKTATTAAKPAPKQLASTTYWIQLASYSSLSRAKGTQEDLKKLGLSTNIEVSDIGGGRLVYRLKAGAWTSEKEALNFLDQFKTSQPRFADAFVVNNRDKR